MNARKSESDNFDDSGLFRDEEFENELPPVSARSRGAILLVPFLVFVGLAVLFLFALQSGDPSKLPSALVGKPAPQFSLPPVEGLVGDNGPVPGFSREDLTRGKVSIVNVWASWCVPCHQEHPFLMESSKRADLQLFGLNYKDAAVSARRFIGRYGNPFDAVGADRDGRVAIDWGVYGVPETFVIDGNGRIAYKLVGPITREILEKQLLPAIERARRAS